MIATIAKAGKQHVEDAVTHALQTFRTSTLTPSERSDILLAASQIAEKRREELELSLVWEVGKTRKDARGELDRVINTLRLSSEEVKRLSGEMVPLAATPGSENRLGFAIRVPKGVIGAITPFNYPLLLSTHKVAPALAGGNTVVLKPSHFNPDLCLFAGGNSGASGPAKGTRQYRNRLRQPGRRLDARRSPDRHVHL